MFCGEGVTYFSFEGLEREMKALVSWSGDKAEADSLPNSSANDAVEAHFLPKDNDAESLLRGSDSDPEPMVCCD